MRYKSAVLFGLLVASELSACAVPSFYTAENLDARVVDAETKLPIPGVIVVASWTLSGGTMEGKPMGSLVAGEAITDNEGRFHIAGWGRTERPSSGILDVLDPEFVLYKPGYLLAYKTNYNPSIPLYDTVDRSVRTSRWNGKDITLEKDNGNPNRFQDNFIGAFVPLYVIYDSPDCKWKRIPRAVHAFEQERLRQLKFERPLRVVPPLELLLSRPNCQ